MIKSHLPTQSSFQEVLTGRDSREFQIGEHFMSGRCCCLRTEVTGPRTLWTFLCTSLQSCLFAIFTTHKNPLPATPEFIRIRFRNWWSLRQIPILVRIWCSASHPFKLPDLGREPWKSLICSKIRQKLWLKWDLPLKTGLQHGRLRPFPKVFPSPGS